LSADSLAKLNQLNQHSARQQDLTPKKTRRKQHREVVDEKIVIERSRRQHKRKKRRVVSGALLEEGNGKTLRGIRGGHGYEKGDYDNEGSGNRKKKICTFYFYFCMMLKLILNSNNCWYIHLTACYHNSSRNSS